MITGLLAMVGIGYYLFAYKGVEKVQPDMVGQSNFWPSRKFQKMVEKVINDNPGYSLPSEIENIGDAYLYTRRYPNNDLPDLEDRLALFDEFEDEVASLRKRGLVEFTKSRYIDKFDKSLQISTVRSMKINDVVRLYQRQVRFLSMFMDGSNSFQILRDVLSSASVYSRPDKDNFKDPKDYAGSFPSFLHDFYFHKYIPSETEWKLYLMQQRMAINEIENDVFLFLNPVKLQQAIDTDGEVTITAFSTVGLELLANLLQPSRTVSPYIDKFEEAFEKKIWKNYFPYTWALVNESDAKVQIKNWKNRTK
ncbi:hypothetical protein ACFQ22_11905 [Lentilactobacillus raoultii]|uniref:Uncharacterized protein n=1 Tax=Lentilactobacillus raoultii TaxID=1987503 RepID=A0ABW3PLE2_9LACO|nr:hypothetical protein [Lentilactobacillus raoultii]